MNNERRYENVFFTSLEDVKENIAKNNVIDVCRSMPSVGMECDYNKQVKQLIENCLKNDSEWIRKAAFICLYHLYVRYRSSMCDDDFVKFIRIGNQDNSTVVKEIMSDILSELKTFSPDIYNIL